MVLQLCDVARRATLQSAWERGRVRRFYRDDTDGGVAGTQAAHMSCRYRRGAGRHKPRAWAPGQEWVSSTGSWSGDGAGKTP